MDKPPRNLSENIRNYIIGNIKRGDWSNGSQMPSESELASRFGVSKHLVNRLYAQLANSGCIVKIHGKGTFVAANASEFFSYSTKSAVFVLARADIHPGQFPFWFHMQEIHEGIEELCKESGYVMAPAYVYEEEAAKFAERMYSGGNTLGFICPTFCFPNLSEELYRLKIPFAQSYWREDKPVDAVYDLYWPAMEKAVSHLLANGRRRVLLLLQDQDTRLTQERRKGYAAAHERHGIPVAKNLEIVSRDIVKNGGRSVMEALRRGLKFDAVMAENDLCAHFIFEEFEKAGIKVPDDIALIGSDDMPGVAALPVPLATIRRARRELGAALFRDLLRRAGDFSAPFITSTVEDKFVKRLSAG